jgi:hypothetical protein
MGNVSLLLSTELEAVNMMLRAIGEAPVSTLEGTTTADVATAIDILSDTNKEVQQKGWHFNTEWDVTLSVDENNRIPLGTDVSSVLSPSKRITMRGISGVMYIYDLDDNTFTFTQAITDAVTVKILDFVDLPQTARNYIMVRASRIFQEEIMGQVSAERVNRQEELQAEADLMDDDADRSGYNVGWGSLDMQKTLKTYRKLW